MLFFVAWENLVFGLSLYMFLLVLFSTRNCIRYSPSFKQTNALFVFSHFVWPAYVLVLICIQLSLWLELLFFLNLLPIRWFLLHFLFFVYKLADEFNIFTFCLCRSNLKYLAGHLELYCFTTFWAQRYAYFLFYH